MPRTKALLERARRQPKLEIPIDWTIVDRLLMDGCTGIEVASYFGVCADTLYLRCVKDKGLTFSHYAAQKRAKGDALIKSKQMSFAINGDCGNSAMLIWLGKNRLGQRDDPITSVEFNGELAKKLDELKLVQKKGVEPCEEPKEKK